MHRVGRIIAERRWLRRVRKGVTAAADAVGAAASVAVALVVWVSFLGQEVSGLVVGLMALSGLGWTAGLSGSRGLGGRLRRSMLDEAPEICRRVLLYPMVVALAAACPLALGGSLDPIGAVVLLAGAGLIFAPAARAAAYASLGRTDVFAGRRILVVGAGEVGRRVARIVNCNPRLDARVVGFVDRRAPFDGVKIEGASGEETAVEGTRGEAEGSEPVLGTPESLPGLLERDVADEVLVAFADVGHEELLKIVLECDRRGVPVSFVPRLYETTTVQSSVENIGGVPLMHLNRVRLKGFNAVKKRTFDLALTSAGLLFVWPLLVLLAVTVKLESPGAVLFAQERVGPEGKKFRMYKFRSMRFDAEAQGTWTRRADPRRTRMGRIMRPLNLDELPQIFNVLRGDLSLVGPRPEQPRYVEVFSESVYRYADRHRIRGGITGWAQVNGLRGDTSIEERAIFDNFYIENWSLWLDAKILILTFCKAGLSAAERACGGSEEHSSNASSASDGRDEETRAERGGKVVV